MGVNSMRTYLVVAATVSVLSGALAFSANFTPSTNTIVGGGIAGGSVENNESMRRQVCIRVNGNEVPGLDDAVLGVGATLSFNSSLEAFAGPGDIIVATIKDLNGDFIDDWTWTVVQPS